MKKVLIYIICVMIIFFLVHKLTININNPTFNINMSLFSNNLIVK